MEEIIDVVKVTDMKKDPIKGFVSTLRSIAGNSDWKEFRKIRDEAEGKSNQKTGRWR